MAAMTNQTVFTTIDGQAWCTRPFRASAPAPRFIRASVFGVARIDRALVSAYAASTMAAPTKPTRSMRSTALMFPAFVGREK